MVLPTNLFILHKKMPEIWGLLPKSQVDDELIEEAIARLILEHNEDETAHLGTGQSLQSHKANEIIDHVVDSIIEDKIKAGEVSMAKLSNKEFQVYTAFESLDGWNKSATGVACAILGTSLQTSTTINTTKYMSVEVYGNDSFNDFSKKVYFQTGIRFDHNTNQTIYFGALGYEGDETDYGVGFKVVGSTLYALILYSDGITRYEKTVEITGFIVDTEQIYRVEHDPDSAETRFYVDGDLKHTETAEVLDGSSPVFFTYNIKNTAAENKMIVLRYLLYSREM